MLNELKLLHAPLTELKLADSGRICLEAIPGYDKWQEMKLIRKRSDLDLLFYIRDQQNRELALRILGERSYDYYSRCYRYQCLINQILNLNHSVEPDKSISYGLCRGGRHVYFCMPWQHDVCFEDIVDSLSLHDKLKPAASAAAYIKAAASISEEKKDGASDLLKFAEDGISPNWMEQIDHRIARVRRILCKRGLDMAALEHYRKFYRANRSLLVKREITICYDRFVPGNWYFQADGSISIPLISDWSYADKWYSLNRLLTDIHATSEDFAILLVDACFAFEPTEEFFICSAIYNMLDILERLVDCHDLHSAKAKRLIARVRSIDHMYAKFTNPIPSWYKIIGNIDHLDIR